MGAVGRIENWKMREMETVVHQRRFSNLLAFFRQFSFSQLLFPSQLKKQIEDEVE